MGNSMSGKVYEGVIQEITLGTTPGDPDSGKAIVNIQGVDRKARVNYTARNARVGDKVYCEKPGNVWYVQSKVKFDPPEPVPAPTGSAPQNAATVTGSNIPTLPLPPEPPQNAPSGNTNNQLYAWAERAAAYFRAIYTWDQLNRARTNDNSNANNALRPAVNTNASRTNAVRDYAAGDRAAVTALRDISIKEGQGR